MGQIGAWTGEKEVAALIYQVAAGHITKGNPTVLQAILAAGHSLLRRASRATRHHPCTACYM